MPFESLILKPVLKSQILTKRVRRGSTVQRGSADKKHQKIDNLDIHICSQGDRHTERREGEREVWYFFGARPVLTPGATPMRSTGNSASTGFWILCTSGPTVWDSIILSWPRFSPTSKTLHF